MNKAEFVAAVAKKASITRAEAARVMDAVFDAETGAISQALHERGELSIPGFGKFTKKRAATDHLVEGDTVTILESAPADASVAGEVVHDGQGNKIAVFKHKRRKVYRHPINLSGDRALPAATVDAEPHESIRELALRVWENQADADEFLKTPHGLLEGQTPLAAARSRAGKARVREILLALEYGLPV